MVRNTWLLSGIPRSGSSLCCRLAGDLPDTVALSEPLPSPLIPDATNQGDVCARIEAFAAQWRAGLLADRRAPSMLVDGRLDDAMVTDERLGEGLRQRQAQVGEVVINKPLSARFTLLIKHNAQFAALLPQLATAAPCLALVRNPLAVLASWQTVNLPVHRGRIPFGERYDEQLRRRLDNEPDVLHRQIAVLNWFFDRYRAHLESDRIVRYESLVASGGQALFRKIGHPDARPVPLENRNGNALYSDVEPDALLQALMKAGGAWSEFYSPADCERVAGMIARGGR